MRLLHTMLRVGNLQRSIDFYTKVMGMTLIRQSENPSQHYSLAFLGYGRNPEHAEIELTYNHGVDSYDMGTAYGHIAIGVPMDMLPIRMEYVVAIFHGRPGRTHYNPLGTVHGGWVATLLDSCVGCAVHTALPAGRSYTTVELKVNFVRALTDAVPLVRAEGRIIHIGRSLGTAEGRLVGPDGKLYAHASTTCFIFDAP